MDYIHHLQYLAESSTGSTIQFAQTFYSPLNYTVNYKSQSLANNNTLLACGVDEPKAKLDL